MDKLLILLILMFINICIKDKKNIDAKDKKEIKTENHVDFKKITYADENLHYEEVISDFLEHIEEYDGD
ncbi:hypothetical protein [Romboutsia ilealis]|uniref:hypothetical protein n=1 Tax=Romboutsia ilealis TaxID=1115758 RepID=UPI00257482FB|nr:hypothetical protein [Romboutsia ilealis]